MGTVNRQQKSAIMFMEKKVRDQIYECLFKEGVMVAEKICKRNAGRMHPDVKNAGSLPVLDLPRLPQAAVCLSSLLLGSHQRRRRVPPRISPPPCRDRPSHHEKTGQNCRKRPTTWRRTCWRPYSGLLARQP